MVIETYLLVAPEQGSRYNTRWSREELQGILGVSAEIQEEMCSTLKVMCGKFGSGHLELPQMLDWQGIVVIPVREFWQGPITRAKGELPFRYQ